MKKTSNGFHWGVFTSFPVLLIAVAVFAGFTAVLWGFNFDTGEGYYVVFMTDKTMYFGNLHRLPELYLTNTFVLQADPADTSTPYRIVKFSDFWGTSDKLILNSRQVLWMSELQSGGGVMNYIISRMTAPDANLPLNP